MRKIVVWGKQNLNRPDEVDSRLLVKDGFVGAKNITIEGQQDLKVPIKKGFWVSYNESTEERIIKIQDAEATGATVVIELYPSSTTGTAETINPQVKRAYIQTNSGQKVELNLGQDDLTNPQNYYAKKILWLLDTNKEEPPTPTIPKTELEKLDKLRADL